MRRSATKWASGQVGKLCERVRTVAGQAMQVGFGDQGHTGQEAEYAAAARAIDWRVVKEPEGQAGLVLLPPALGRRTELRLAEPAPLVSPRL